MCTFCWTSSWFPPLAGLFRVTGTFGESHHAFVNTCVDDQFTLDILDSEYFERTIIDVTVPEKLVLNRNMFPVSRRSIHVKFDVTFASSWLRRHIAWWSWYSDILWKFKFNRSALVVSKTKMKDSQNFMRYQSMFLLFHFVLYKILFDIGGN